MFIVLAIVIASLWFAREVQHSKQIDRLIELYKSQNLSEYKAADAKPGSQKNFIKEPMQDAYKNNYLRGE